MSPRKHDSRPERPASEKAQTPDDAAPDDAGGEEGSEPTVEEPSGWGKGAAAADLEALRTENAELKDRMLRTMAEMENLRRRTERDKADTIKFAITAFARDVLTAADNIARAIAAVPQGAADSDPALKALLEGVEVTERELLNALERHGITKLDPKGERFDPNRHQAMLEIENKDVPAGTVVEVLQPGFLIADRVLRPALVGVSKGGEKLPKAETAPSAANGNAPEEEDKSNEAEDGGSGSLGGNVDRSA